MKNVRALLKEILKEIKPSPKEERELLSFAQRCLKVTKRVAKRYKAEAMLVGSLTRKTWLKDKREFDIFILFPEDTPIQRLEKYGLLIGKKVVEKLKGTCTIEYAQHPYVSAEVNSVKIDLVPCYKLKSAEKLKSAVDRTPFHVAWLKKHLKQKQSNEVRLLKAFLKAHELYGADAKIQGFSGYASELLIIAYKSFLGVLKASLEWQPGTVIDLEGFYKPKVSCLFSL